MTANVSEVTQLPRVLRKKWRGSQVYVVSTGSLFVAKKIQKTPSSSIRERLRVAGNTLNAKDIEKAVRAARS